MAHCGRLDEQPRLIVLALTVHLLHDRDTNRISVVIFRNQDATFLYHLGCDRQGSR